ncbi:MAG: hypothetical protein KJ690_15980, partial [Alphaproteobacteria bacterium]|nr:hypothetical protein [Alphaproteobacteria bacterium]
GVPKYRVVWSFPDKAKPGHLGALTFNSDEDAIRETEQILRDRPGAMAEIWRPDRDLLISRLGPFD